MWCRLVGLDKILGLRPICIGDFFHRLFYKLVLLVAGKEASNACRTNYLYSGLTVEIKGAIHHMRLSWEEHQVDETP